MADFPYIYAHRTSGKYIYGIKFPHAFSITAEHDDEQSYCMHTKKESRQKTTWRERVQKNGKKLSRKWILQVEHLNCNVIQIIFYRNFICWICFFLPPHVPRRKSRCAYRFVRAAAHIVQPHVKRNISSVAFAYIHAWAKGKITGRKNCSSYSRKKGAWSRKKKTCFARQVLYCSRCIRGKSKQFYWSLLGTKIRVQQPLNSLVERITSNILSD